MTDLIKQLTEQVNQADLVLIGLGEELEDNFSNFKVEYQGILECLEKDDWRIPFLKSYYLSNQTDNKYIKALIQLKELVQNKNYFIITTSKDGYVHKAGFDENKIVTPCGNYDLLQCVDHCNDELISAKEIAQNIYDHLKNGENHKQPVCETCGESLCFNNVYAGKYNEQGYMDQWQKYTKWLQGTINRKVCILELGVGLKYPTVIRWPFEKVAMYNLKASFFRVHENLYQLPDEISEKGASIKMNALDFLMKL